MPPAFYFDHHVPTAIARGLRLRGVMVITAFEDGFDRRDDEALLLRATSLGHVLLTQDPSHVDSCQKAGALARCST